MLVFLKVVRACYYLFTAFQIWMIIKNDAENEDVTWWTCLYPIIVTSAVAMFNWEFNLLCDMVAAPERAWYIWALLIILVVSSYWAYAYYPIMKENPFWGPEYSYRVARAKQHEKMAVKKAEKRAMATKTQKKLRKERSLFEKFMRKIARRLVALIENY